MTKQQMIEYITGFDLYPTMNSWNNSYGYSFNVKIHSLPLTSDQKDKMYDILSDGNLSDEFYSDCNLFIRDYENEINAIWDEARHDPLQHITELYPDKRHKSRCDYCYTATWYDPGKECQKCHKGRLQEIKYNEDWLEWLKHKQFEIAFNGRSSGHLVLYKWNGYNYTGTGWHHDLDELNEMSKGDVERIYQVLKLFEKCYESLLDLCRQYGKYEIEDFEEEETIIVTGKRFANQ